MLPLQGTTQTLKNWVYKIYQHLLKYVQIYQNICQYRGGVGPRLFAMIALEIYGVGLANSPSTPHPMITEGHYNICALINPTAGLMGPVEPVMNPSGTRYHPINQPHCGHLWSMDHGPKHYEVRYKPILQQGCPSCWGQKSRRSLWIRAKGAQNDSRSSKTGIK